MVLHGENRELFVAQAFNGIIVEVDFGDDASAFFQTLGIGGETVVLSGDGDATCFEVLDRLVTAAMR